MSKKGDCYDNAAMNRFDFKAMILTFHGERFCHVQMPNIKYSLILKCITIANSCIPNWAILVQKLLKLKKSLNYVSEKSGQDQSLNNTYLMQ